MARPKKFYEQRDPFSMYIPHTLNDVIDEKCHKERKNKCQYFIDLAMHDVGVQKNTSIGVTYDHNRYVQQQQLMDTEDKNEIIMKNFQVAFMEILDVIADMDTDTFVKFKTSVWNRLHETRGPNYKRDKKPELIRSLQQQ